FFCHGFLLFLFSFLYVRKNSCTSSFCVLLSTRKSRPFTGRPPSCANAGVSCCTMAPMRVRLFCSHGSTIVPCRRFLTLVAISGALMTHSHQFLYGSSMLRLGFFRTSWL